MKRNITILLAGLLSTAVFMPLTARACDGSCGGGNGSDHNWKHHQAQTQTPGTGEGLNKGVNLSLDQNQQNHNQGQGHDKNWAANHKWHNHTTT